MAVLTAALQDGSDVFGEGDVTGDGGKLVGGESDTEERS
jgi:hypothetical protein